jgi:mannose-6-phosphate isomerase-like protein (cupin superfamily)
VLGVQDRVAYVPQTGDLGGLCGTRPSSGPRRAQEQARECADRRKRLRGARTWAGAISRFRAATRRSSSWRARIIWYRTSVVVVIVIWHHQSGVRCGCTVGTAFARGLTRRWNLRWKIGGFSAHAVADRSTNGTPWCRSSSTAPIRCSDIWKGPMRKVRVAEGLRRFDDVWRPQIVAEMNDYKVQLVKGEGELVWRRHDDTDELFFVITGHLTMRTQEGDVALEAGDLLVVPKGAEHCPVASDVCQLLLIEPLGTPNTGDAGGERSAPKERLGRVSADPSPAAGQLRVPARSGVARPAQARDGSLAPATPSRRLRSQGSSDACPAICAVRRLPLLERFRGRAHRAAAHRAMDVLGDASAVRCAFVALSHWHRSNRAGQATSRGGGTFSGRFIADANRMQGSLVQSPTETPR